MQVESAAPDNPFVGLRSFQRHERALFFGRDREVSEVLSGIIANRTFLLYASSGAGKSSLVNAGVAPKLADEGFDILPPVRVRGLGDTPDAIDSAHNIFTWNVLGNWADNEESQRVATPSGQSISSSRQRQRRPPSGRHNLRRELRLWSLADFLAERERVFDEDGEPMPRVIVFDQFEELFTGHPKSWSHREGFLLEVKEALELEPFLRTAFVIREDYLAQLDPYTSILRDGMRARLRLEGLRESNALQAINGPLQRTARRLTSEAAQQLVADLQTIHVDTGSGDFEEFRGEFVEPVQLQVVCESLWRELPDDVTLITTDHLQDYGAVDEVLGRFYADAMREAANNVGLDERELRSWFESQFITDMGTRSTVYRTADMTAGVPNAAIDAMESRHLIRAEWRSGARWYELVHDRLIEPIRASNREAIRLSLTQMPDFEPVEAANESLRIAEEARWNYRFDEAVTQTKEAIDLFQSIGHRPGEARAHLELGTTLQEKGDLSAAIAANAQARNVFHALDDKRGEANALLAIGSVEELRDSPDAALKQYSAARALAEAARDGALLAWLADRSGWLLETTGQEAAAAAIYQEAAGLLTELGDATAAATTLMLYAGVEQLLGETEAAEDAYEVALQVYKRADDREMAASALANLGSLALDAEDYETALARYSEAIEIGSRNPAAHLGRGSAYWYAGRLEEALRDLNLAISLFRDDSDTLSARGQVLAELGRFDDASADLNLAIGMGGPSLPYALSGLGLAKGALGEFEGAYASFESSLALEPENAWAYYNRALTHERQGNHEDAVEDFKRALGFMSPSLTPLKRAIAGAFVSEAQASIPDGGPIRETQVLEIIARGHDIKQAASILHTTEGAVEAQLGTIYAHLHHPDHGALVALPAPQ